MKALLLSVMLGACSTTGVSQYDALVKVGGYVTYADKTLTIMESYGGEAGDFEAAAITLALRGDKLVIDGGCYSACGYLLDIVDNACFTQHAYVGYHMLKSGTEYYYPKDYYRKAVYDWVSRNGGWYSDRFTFMSGGQLLQFYKACE